MIMEVLFYFVFDAFSNLMHTFAHFFARCCKLEAHHSHFTNSDGCALSMKQMASTDVKLMHLVWISLYSPMWSVRCWRNGGSMVVDGGGGCGSGGGGLVFAHAFKIIKFCLKKNMPPMCWFNVSLHHSGNKISFFFVFGGGVVAWQWIYPLRSG